MPDLLSHVLFAYAAFQLAAVRWPVGRHEVAAGLLGAILPDAGKIGLFLDDDGLEAALGSPVDFLGWHTVAGVGLSIVVLSLLTGEGYRPRVTAFLVAGAAGHLVLDLLLRTAAGVAPYALLWPIVGSRPPVAGWYLSGDIQVLALAVVTAAVSWSITQIAARE